MEATIELRVSEGEKKVESTIGFGFWELRSKWKRPSASQFELQPSDHAGSDMLPITLQRGVEVALDPKP